MRGGAWLVSFAFVLATLCAPARACERPCCPKIAAQSAPIIDAEPCCGRIAPAHAPATPVVVPGHDAPVAAPPVALATVSVAAPPHLPLRARPVPDVAARPPPAPLFLVHRSLLV